jgi:phosphoglycolate phosphatase
MTLPIVAFDLDGTLVDSVHDLAVALNGALAELGLPTHDVEVVRGFIGHGARNLVLSALGAHADRVDDVMPRFRARYERALDVHTRVFPGVQEALSSLRGRATLAVATNKPGALARSLVDRLLPGHFRLVLGPDDTGSLKPDPQVLRVIEQSLRGPLVAFVGDSSVDMATAKNRGVPGIAVTWGLAERTALADATRIVDDGPALTAALDALLPPPR